MITIPVIKRDGEIVEFDAKKIATAISKANDSLTNRTNRATKKEIENIVDEIEKECKKLADKNRTVEAIQNLVEEKLLDHGKRKLARSYIAYREERTRVRNRNNKFFKDVFDKAFAKNIMNQNANVDEASFGGRKGEAANIMLKRLALDEVMSELHRKNHEENRIYIHDLDSYLLGMHNCLSLPTSKLLERGAEIRQTDIRPASSVATALQLLAVYDQIQSLQQFGGVAETKLDWTMVPYIRMSFFKHYKSVLSILSIKTFDVLDKDKTWAKNVSINDSVYKGKHWFNFIHKYVWKHAMILTEKELKQSVEGMYHNLNSLMSRSGNQLPFSSINYGTCTLPEGRMVTKALLEGSLNGIGKFHKTPIFPCGIFKYKQGINDKPGTPNYDLKKLAIKSTVRRLYPNYANCNWSVNDAAIKYDRDIKTQVLNKLRTDDPVSYLNLCHFLDEHKDIADFLRIKFLAVNCLFANADDVSLVSINPIMEPYPDEEMATMGCVDGKETISYRYLLNERLPVMSFNKEEPIKMRTFTEHSSVSFEYMWEEMSKYFEIKTQTSDPDCKNLYMDLENVEIFDSNCGWVECKRLIRNVAKRWVKISCSDGLTLDCTYDHPLPTARGRVYAGSITTMDTIYKAIPKGDGSMYELRVHSVSPYVETKYSYDVTTSSDHFDVSGIWSHNCRTYNGADINFDKAFKHNLSLAISGETDKTKYLDLLSAAQKDGRGNIAPNTIILPTVAMECKTGKVKFSEDLVENFMLYLDQLIGEARDQLIERFEYICTQPKDAAKFMYENGTMVGYIPEQGIRSALEHGTLVIGQLGLSEALKILIGEDQTSDKGMELAKRIEVLYKQRCAEFKTKYKLNFGVYYTPAESLCFTAMTKFTETYGLIEGVNAYKDETGKLVGRTYFTNSIHVPVWDKMSPFKKIDIESELTGYSSGGCITYVELGENAVRNEVAVEQILDYEMHERDIPYAAFNLPNLTCTCCGYQGKMGFNDSGEYICPECGSSKVDELGRVTGYLSGTVKHFNKGKQDEYHDRFKHTSYLDSWIEG